MDLRRVVLDMSSDRLILVEGNSSVCAFQRTDADYIAHLNVSLREEEDLDKRVVREAKKVERETRKTPQFYQLYKLGLDSQRYSLHFWKLPKDQEPRPVYELDEEYSRAFYDSIVND